MAKRIIWSHRAQHDRVNIFSYWNNRNKTNLYSKKLNSLFREALNTIQRYPRIGKRTDIENVRAKNVKDYTIIYEETREYIEILTIWDNRQDPEKLKIKNS